MVARQFHWHEIRRRRKNRNRKARAGKNSLPAGRQAPPQLLEPEDFSEPERPSFLFARPSVQFGARSTPSVPFKKGSSFVQ